MNLIEVLMLITVGYSVFALASTVAEWSGRFTVRTWFVLTAVLCGLLTYSVVSFK